MKTISITQGGGWIERRQPSESQLTELETATDERREEILASLLPPASAEDSSAAQAIYDAHKINGAELIACDIALPSNSGIINCRVDGEHIQIRF